MSVAGLYFSFTMTPQYLTATGCGLLGLLLAGCTSANAKTPEPVRQPNIIFILADDLGIGDVTPYGQKLIRTPNLDHMQQHGTRFTNAYAGTAVSAPSRASLLTGQHTGHTHIRGNLRHDPEGQVAMPDSTYTMARMFKDAGYSTGCFGKWGLGYPGSESDPTKVGFDKFYGYNCQTLAHDYYPDHLWADSTRVEFSENYNQAEGTYSADHIHGKALDFIRSHADAPFFTFLSYTLPHAELIVPDDSVYQYYCSVIPKADDQAWKAKNPNIVGAYGDTERPLASFATMVTKLDGYVGDVMNLLDSLGIADNTLVIFTSDNGPHREGGANPDYFQSYGPYRGIKRDLYEGGIHMPMLAVWPGKVPAGVDNDHMLAFWDVMPTFAELAGFDYKAPTDGISFVPSLLGLKGQAEHPFLYWEFHEGGGKQAMRMGQWKGVKLNVGKPGETRFELYDLTTDIHEDNDVAAQHPEVVARMEQMMDSVRTSSSLFNFRNGLR